jgi:hypothetical protein
MSVKCGLYGLEEGELPQIGARNQSLDNACSHNYGRRQQDISSISKRTRLICNRMTTQGSNQHGANLC